MKFKRIYIEITNICNLNCSFCSKSKLEKRSLTVEQFKLILNKINKYTDYIYLHVKGEPLTYKYLDDILNLTKKYNKKVIITTNGVLLKERLDILKKYNNIYKINISLHSENKKENYLEDIFYAVDNLEYPYINYRLWTLNENKMDKRLLKIVNILKERYNIDNVSNNMCLDNKVYLSLDNEFEWPSLDNNYINENGYCYGGKTQLAILSNGNVSICCLDSEGISNLGNIFIDSMENILESDKYQKAKEGFNNRYAYLDICKHCKYKNKLEKNK